MSFMRTQPECIPPGTIFSCECDFVGDLVVKFRNVQCTVVMVVISIATILCSPAIGRIIKSYRALFASVDWSRRWYFRSFVVSLSIGRTKT